MELSLFKQIVDNLDGAAITDSQGRYLYANHGWEQCMGLSFSEVQGKSAQEVVSNSRIMEALESGKSVLGIPIRQDGHEMFSNYQPILENSVVIGCFIQIIFGNVEDALLFSNKVNQFKSELSYYKNALSQLSSQTYKYTLDRIVGSSAAVERLKEQIKMAANSLSNVLVIGETGSGKELVAHAIHTLGQRRDKPFIKINCAAIPPELAESEFFGYEYGAFTGAKRGGKSGLFEQADKGSLFLDEINQMSYYIQPKILRVLQEREVDRIGGKVGIPIDVRVIAASNQPLENLVSENLFRQDLFYRLNVVRIRVPPLRERMSDIPALVSDIIDRLNYQLGMRIEGITPEVLLRFQSYDWPGNIRELQNVVEQAMNIKGSGMLDMACFEDYFGGHSLKKISSGLGEGTLEQQKRELERILITDTYKKLGGNKRKTAEALGISRPMLYQRLKSFGMLK